MVSIWFGDIGDRPQPVALARAASPRPPRSAGPRPSRAPHRSADCRRCRRPPAGGHCAPPARTHPGADRLACSAVVRSPSCITTASPVSRSVATARNGVGNWSKSVTPATCRVFWRSSCVSFWPWIRPLGSRKRPSRKPSGSCTRKSRSSRRRRKFRPARAGRSLKASAQSTLSNTCSDLAGRHAAGVQPAHHGAHAGAGNGIDGNVQLLPAPAAHPHARRRAPRRRTAPGRCGAGPAATAARHRRPRRLAPCGPTGTMARASNPTSKAVSARHASGLPRHNRPRRHLGHAR